MKGLRISVLSECLKAMLVAIIVMASVASARFQGDTVALSLALGGNSVICITNPARERPDL